MSYVGAIRLLRDICLDLQIFMSVPHSRNKCGVYWMLLNSLLKLTEIVKLRLIVGEKWACAR